MLLIHIPHSSLTHSIRFTCPSPSISTTSFVSNHFYYQHRPQMYRSFVRHSLEFSHHQFSSQITSNSQIHKFRQ
ncbi:hypothetical protein RYX36_036092 [Vicia faba]